MTLRASPPARRHAVFWWRAEGWGGKIRPVEAVEAPLWLGDTALAFLVALRRLGPLGLFALLAACGPGPEKIVHGLTERDANEIVVVLEEFGIGVSKLEGDSEEGIVWDIEVARGDASMARRILVAEGLPRVADHGYGDAAASTGMIPSASDEEMKKLHAWQGEIDAQLRKIESVIDARTVLSIPSRDTLELEDVVEPSASVVLRLRRPRDGEELTIDEERVKEIVAGTVPKLVPERVQVVQAYSRITLPTEAEIRDRKESAPVSAGGDGAVRLALFGALGLVVLLALLLVFAGKQKKDLKRRVIALQRAVQGQS